MSQYEHKLEDGRLTVRFGWDPPLQTFFFQEIDETIDPDEEGPIVWLGTGLREIYEVENLVRVVPNKYRSLVVSQEARLYRDKDKNR